MAASCSQDRLVGLGQDTPIQFRAVMDRQTKATALSTGMTDFNVTAWKGGDDHASVQPHIDQGWMQNVPLYAIEAFMGILRHSSTP